MSRTSVLNLFKKMLKVTWNPSQGDNKRVGQNICIYNTNISLKPLADPVKTLMKLMIGSLI